MATDFPMLLAQQDPFGGNDAAAAAGGGIVGMLCMVMYLAMIVVSIAGMWKTFEKAGKPGWACIIPIYNLVVMAEIAEKPVWWGLLILVPCVGVVFAILIPIEIAQKFGQGAGFGLGLAFLPFIFYVMLGFGNYSYQGSGHAAY